MTGISEPLLSGKAIGPTATGGRSTKEAGSDYRETQLNLRGANFGENSHAELETSPDTLQLHSRRSKSQEEDLRSIPFGSQVHDFNTGRASSASLNFAKSEFGLPPRKYSGDDDINTRSSEAPTADKFGQMSTASNVRAKDEGKNFQASSITASLSPDRSSALAGPMRGIHVDQSRVAGGFDEVIDVKRSGDALLRGSARKRPVSMYNLGENSIRSCGMKRPISFLHNNQKCQDLCLPQIPAMHEVSLPRPQQRKDEDTNSRVQRSKGRQDPMESHEETGLHQAQMQGYQGLPHPVHPSSAQTPGRDLHGRRERFQREAPSRPPLPSLPPITLPPDSAQAQRNTSDERGLSQYVHNYHFHGPVNFYQDPRGEHRVVPTQEGAPESTRHTSQVHQPGSFPQHPPGGGGFQSTLRSMSPYRPPPTQPHGMHRGEQAVKSTSPTLFSQALHQHPRFEPHYQERPYSHQSIALPRLSAEQQPHNYDTPPSSSTASRLTAMEPPIKRPFTRPSMQNFRAPSLSMPSMGSRFANLSGAFQPVTGPIYNTALNNYLRPEFNLSPLSGQRVDMYSEAGSPSVSNPNTTNMNDWEFVVEMYRQGIGTPDGRPLKEHSKSEGVFADRKLLEKRRTIGKTYEKLGKELFERAIGYKLDEVSGERKKQRMYHVIARCRAVNAIRKAGGTIPSDPDELERLLDTHIQRKKELKYAQRQESALMTKESAHINL